VHLKDFTMYLRNEGAGNTGKHAPVKNYFYCECAAGGWMFHPLSTNVLFPHCWLQSLLTSKHPTHPPHPTHHRVLQRQLWRWVKCCASPCLVINSSLGARLVPSRCTSTIQHWRCTQISEYQSDPPTPLLSTNADTGGLVTDTWQEWEWKKLQFLQKRFGELH